MSDMSPVEEAIRNFILREILVGENPGELTNSTPLVTTAILDSLATLKLILFLEDEFRISFEPQEVGSEHLDTIERIATLVRSKVRSRLESPGD